jgi:hypothetical protein
MFESTALGLVLGRSSQHCTATPHDRIHCKLLLGNSTARLLKKRNPVYSTEWLDASTSSSAAFVSAGRPRWNARHEWLNEKVFLPSLLIGEVVDSSYVRTLGEVDLRSCVPVLGSRVKRCDDYF